MSLWLPSELVVERFLPTARTMLVVSLLERGLTQQEVAGHLGITQAAVSKHANGAIAVEPRFRDDPRMERTVERIADGLATGEMDGYETLAELLALVREFEDRGPICELHEEVMPELAGLGCDLCIRGADGDALVERDALSTVRKAARRLSSEPMAARYVPHVGTNVGTALPGASELADVAAIPGRITEMNGRLHVPADPEFGASRHVATALLAAIAVDPDVRGALNIATADELLEAARERGLDVVEFDPAYEQREAHLETVFEDRGAVPAVAYHRGAFAIEPITYVFGGTALDAVSLACSLLRDG